jgi:hypothetical protein
MSGGISMCAAAPSMPSDAKVLQITLMREIPGT